MASTSTFMQGIESLRNVEWSRSYLWDVKFGPGADKDKNPAPPAPFDTWAPASDYSETAHTSTLLTHQFYLSTYKFMYQGNSTDIQMTLHDDVYGTMYHWLTDWFHNTLRDDDGVAMLQDSWRTLYVMKLDTLRNTLRYFIYYVIPEGTVTETLNSHADTKQYNVSFAVIGREVPVDSSASLNSESANDMLNTDQSSQALVPTFGTQE